MRSSVEELIKEKMDESKSIRAFDILKGIKCIEITPGASRGCNPNVLYLTLCWDDGDEEFRYCTSLWKPTYRGDTSLGDQLLNIIISVYAIRMMYGKYF